MVQSELCKKTFLPSSIYAITLSYVSYKSKSIVYHRFFDTAIAQVAVRLSTYVSLD